VCTITTVLEFIGELAAMTVGAISEVFTLLQPVSIITILIVATFDNHVTVFAVSGKVDIISIFIVGTDKCLMRNSI